MKILIIEDEPKIGSSLERGLKNEGYEVKLVNDGYKGIDEIVKFYDLALVDLMLPGINGIEIAKQIKIENPKTKIIFLTSKSTLEDKLEGFENGGDDYVTKPFSFDELVARIKAVLRRNEDLVNEIKFKDIELNIFKNTIFIKGEEVKLSKKEFELLKFLILNKNKVFTKEELIEKVWGIDSDILPNTVEVFIKTIRDKIEKPYNIHIIETKRGFGYTLNI